MADKLEKYTLKNPNWYDSDGRIYKDVLIENFNDIENRLIELTELDVLNFPLPDFSTISYPDITDLSTADDNAIVNLKSFLALFNLIDYPMEIQFDGTKCTKIAWWGSDYQYHVVEDDSTAAKSSTPYIYFNPNPSDGNYVYATNSSTTTDGSQFIGFYADGRVVTMFDGIFIDKG